MRDISLYLSTIPDYNQMLAGKNVLITTAARGIGKSIALLFARQGADVYFGGRNEEYVRTTEKELQLIRPGCRGYVVDLAKADQTEAFVDAAVKDSGGFDILVSTVGVNCHCPAAEYKDEEIPTGRGLCHLYACGDVIYGSCFENGLYFAVDSALTRILWQFQPAGANAHWVQSVGHALFLADLGNSRLYRLALENNLPTGSVKTLPQPTGSGPRQVLDAGDGMLDCVYELDGHMRVLNHDGCTVSTVQASTVPKSRSWPGGACATADGTLFVSNRGPNTISAWQRSGPTRHFLCEWPTGDWPRALCAVPGTLYLLAACQREGAVHCYYCSPLPHRAPTETASLALPGASCALVLD